MSNSKKSSYFLLGGGVGLSFTIPVGGTHTKLGGHKDSGKRTSKEVVSWLVSTQVRQNYLKLPAFFMFFSDYMDTYICDPAK